MLTLNHVTKYYGKNLANDDISFQVDSGQIAILLGPNGAGKSTLMKTILGLLTPLEGSVDLGGGVPGFSGSRVTSPSVATETKPPRPNVCWPISLKHQRCMTCSPSQSIWSLSGGPTA